MLELENVHSYYGMSHILHGISFSVRPGEALSILGRNGAGKTTALLTIMGYLKPRPGTIRFKGRDLASLAPHQRAKLGFGFVPQERGIFRSLTVRENLTVAMRPGRDGRWGLDEVFRLFPRLAERQANFGDQLSGGEQQMLSIARALMLNPEILLLDEPSEGLAPVIVDEIVSVLRSLKKEGLPIVLVEQNVFAAMAVADRHVVFNKGAIRMAGTAADLATDNSNLLSHLAV